MLCTAEITLEIPGNNSQRVIHAIFTSRRSHCADGRHTFFFNAFCSFEQRSPSGSGVNLRLFVRKEHELDGSLQKGSSFFISRRLTTLSTVSITQP